MARFWLALGWGCSASTPTSADSSAPGTDTADECRRRCADSPTFGESADTGPTKTSCTAAPIALTCGTGDLKFGPLTDGAEVTMVHGPQGGWHVWTAVSTEHSEQIVALWPTVTLPGLGDLQVSSNPPPGDFVALSYDEETCTGTYFGQRAFLDPLVLDPDPAQGQQVICGLAGEPLHLRVELTEVSTKRTGSCEVDVVARLDDADVAACDTK